jgi:hypothetical protein
VKDWPKDASDAFKYVKNELWKWVKKENCQNRSGLALIAYEAVKNEFEGEYDRRAEERKNAPVIIMDEAADWEEVCRQISKIKSER